MPEAGTISPGLWTAIRRRHPDRRMLAETANTGQSVVLKECAEEKRGCLAGLPYSGEADSAAYLSLNMAQF